MASRLVDALGFQSAPVEPPLDVSGRNAFLKLLGLENVGNYLSNPAPPPIPNMPATPGKIPETTDYRPGGALLELGAFAAGMGPIGGAAKGVPALAKALAPKAGIPESVKWAAINLEGKTFTGVTHTDAIETAAKQMGMTFDQVAERARAGDLDGFITNTGRYVDRIEAGKIAEQASQLKTGRILTAAEDPSRPAGVVGLLADDLKEQHSGLDLLLKGLKDKKPANETIEHQWSTPKLEPAGISGFHGSQHDFPAEPGFPLGRFRSDKIGTGEGNQAFSHGHYIGGAEGTARTYAPPGGKMYEVAIKAEPEDFLHWDKPIAEQSPQVQAAMAPILKEHGLDQENLNYLAGTHILNRMSDSASSSPAVSARLREAGIPGIRYLDEGSRAAGAGSHNYAVFDEKLIEILRKYGITGQ